MNQPPENIHLTAERIGYLVAGYIRHTLTPAEHDELDRWVEASDDNMKMFEDLTDENHLQQHLATMDSIDTKAQLRQVKKNIAFTKRKTVNLWPYAVAAALVIVAIAVYLFAIPAKETVLAEQPILPAPRSVRLTSGDGAVINVSAAANGVLKNEQGGVVTKSGEQLIYQAEASTPTASINTLSTSTGSQYQLTLSDGTRVWLNAASSITFPVSFTAKERVVQLAGEAYFEVAKDAGKPFRVEMQDNTGVTVLGTHFNIRDYEEAASREVTLVEGSVALHYGNQEQLLLPAQQAVISNRNITLNGNIDTEAITGWKNNRFVFSDAPITTIMQEAARWYDITVVYEADVPYLFNATISRNEPLSKLLQLLEMTGKIHFTVKNKTIYVKR